MIGTLLTTENLLFPAAVKQYYLYHQKIAENSILGTAVGKSCYMVITSMRSYLWMSLLFAKNDCSGVRRSFFQVRWI